MIGEIILAVLGLASGVLAYLRGGGASARKELDKLEKAYKAERQKRVLIEGHSEELERKYLELKKKYNESLTDDDLRMLARQLYVGENGTDR